MFLSLHDVYTTLRFMEIENWVTSYKKYFSVRSQILLLSIWVTMLNIEGNKIDK